MKCIRYFLLVFFCLFVYICTFVYRPLRNTLVHTMPQPTEFSRQAEMYDAATFGTPIFAGFSKKEITPTRGSWLAGYHPPHRQVYINDRLWVKSIALRDERGETIVIVSCDLIGLLPDDIAYIKYLVWEIIYPDNIFISCTHTHSGPDTIGIWGPIPIVVSGKDKKYMYFLRQQIAHAITESVAGLSDASIRFGSGALHGFVAGREGNANDESVTVMQVLIGGDMPVTLINFACHADVFKSLYLSADFPYYLYERMRKLTGGETLFIPGAIGGVQPTSESLQFQHAKVMGERLADEVVFHILKKTTAPHTASMTVDRKIVTAPLENNYFKFGIRTGALPKLQNEKGLITAEVNRISIGSAEILTVPGELFPNIWWHIKPLMQGEFKFIFGVTNGEYGYILTPEDFASGKHAYHASVSVGSQFGSDIEKALAQLTTEH